MRKFLKVTTVEDKIGFGRTFIYDSIREGTFPRQIKFGPRASRWDSDEVDAWMAERKAERDSNEAHAAA